MSIGRGALLFFAYGVGWLSGQAFNVAFALVLAWMHDKRLRFDEL